MAGVCLKFRPGLIKTVIEAMCNDASAKWPTSGEMNEILKLKARSIERAKDKPRSQAPKTFVSKADIAQAFRSDAGQHALAIGYGPSFLSDIRTGTTIEQASTGAYKLKRKKALDERLEITKQLEAGNCPIAPDVKGSQLRMLISLGNAVVKKNNELLEIYGL